MSFARSLQLLALLAFGAILSIAGTASADEPEDEGAAKPGAAVVRPAVTHTDPKSGAQTVTVPTGCTATTHSSGQVVILCPFREPGSSQPHQHLDTKWYGWQILLVDGASLLTGTLVAVAGNDSGGAGAAIILGGYALGGPIVHWSNGQIGKGFASLGLRLGAPAVGALTGLALGAASSAGGCGGECAGEGAAVGAAIGLVAGGVAAVVIDSAALARKQVVVTDDEHATRPKIQWAPTGGYDAKRQATTIGITGTF